MSRAKIAAPRRPWIVLGLAGAMLFGAVRPAHAIFGEDIAVLAAILKQDVAILLQAVQTVEQLRASVEHLKGMLDRAETMLKKANLRSLQGVKSLIKEARQMDQDVMHEVKLMGFNAKKVVSEVRSFYDVNDVKPEDMRKKARTWNTVIGESSRAAMIAQTNVESLQKRAQTQQDLLDDSKDADGIVAQLQLVVRNLALLHQSMESMQRSLDTGMRVTASMAAKASSTEDMAEKHNELRMKGYTDKPPAATVYSLKWPGRTE